MDWIGNSPGSRTGVVSGISANAGQRAGPLLELVDIYTTSDPPPPPTSRNNPRLLQNSGRVLDLFLSFQLSKDIQGHFVPAFKSSRIRVGNPFHESNDPVVTIGAEVAKKAGA
ncbi:Hypothetical protein NTJ_10406 [Nesidiocoris tenuis]|uniref:Uncharacterized protein n=1 Tax=Nesidiocoris tenuis TaxID=355587 RepID=A0ABN7B1V0_9HEMI|nr:Hypothetical protein NTJ_10406 [Nesidiocoris tenuis]